MASYARVGEGVASPRELGPVFHVRPELDHRRSCHPNFVWPSEAVPVKPYGCRPRPLAGGEEIAAVPPQGDKNPIPAIGPFGGLTFYLVQTEHIHKVGLV